MATSNSSEEASSSDTIKPNELCIRTSGVSRPSNIISSIQIENSRTPFTGANNSYHYQHRPMLSQLHRNTQNCNAISYPVPNTVVFQAQPISKNYQGNHLAQRNQSANIAPEKSTSVWITNLPPNCNYADLLGMVRDAGKIYATVINGPDNIHITSAAKIVFFDVEGRQRFEACANAGQFVVRAYVPRVRPNRILTAAQPAGPQSRVLLITGPASVVKGDVLLDYFRRWCAFDIEYVERLPLEGGNVTMVWAFASYRSQAERVFAAIRDIKAYNLYSPGRGFWDSIIVRYGPDPCDR